jgi:uncharacterized surface anchored protein
MADILIGTQVTDANGVVTFTNLPPGNYKYVQKSAKNGYTVDTTEYTFTVESTTPIEETRTNEPAETGTLEITKHVDGFPALVLPGATFSLKDSTGKIVQSVSSPSGADGKITFPNLMSITGSPQEYQVQEVTPPQNYELNENVYEVEVTVDATATQAVPNTPSVEGELEITLTDANYTEYTLTGAEYELYWVDDN